MANSRATAEDPGEIVPGSKEALREWCQMEREQTGETVTGQTWNNLNIKINNDSKRFSPME